MESRSYLYTATCTMCVGTYMMKYVKHRFLTRFYITSHVRKIQKFFTADKRVLCLTVQTHTEVGSYTAAYRQIHLTMMQSVFRTFFVKEFKSDLRFLKFLAVRARHFLREKNDGARESEGDKVETTSQVFCVIQA